MNYKYHRNTLIASDHNHPMVKKCLTMLDGFEQAVEDFCENIIDAETYFERITEYDTYMFMSARSKPQKSNPINTLQNKKYSTYREMITLPIWYHLISRLKKLEQWADIDLAVIQNISILETKYSNGKYNTKDVDGGIAIRTQINGEKKYIPVIAVEDKGGHACKTTVNGVNAIGLRLHQSFPTAIFGFVTDNNVTVGKKQGSEIIDNTNFFLCERGEIDGWDKNYQPLKAYRFVNLEEQLFGYLKDMQPSKFLNYNTIFSSSNKTLRDMLRETGGVITNFPK